MAELTWHMIEALAIQRDKDAPLQHDFDSIRELIFKLSYALTLDYALAEDLAQDCLIKVWQHRGRLGQLDVPEAWIAKIVRNKAKNYWKRRPKWLQIPSNAVTPGEQDPVMIELKSFISQLKEEQREVVLLVAVYGFTYPEAGAILEIPAGTVASRYSFAKKELQRRMGERE
jgi:RNA polymerase sigma-70 factor (ECF subfamily)